MDIFINQANRAEIVSALTKVIKHELTEMEKRIMSQLDELRQGEADVKQGQADVKQAISDAADRVGAKLDAQQAKFDALQAKLNDQPLPAPVAEDLSSDIQAMKDDTLAMKDDVAALAKVGADADPAAPAAPPVVAVGDVIGIPTDPTDPTSPAADHTITAIAADGTITAEPVATTDSGTSADPVTGDTPAAA